EPYPPVHTIHLPVVRPAYALRVCAARGRRPVGTPASPGARSAGKMADTIAVPRTRACRMSIPPGRLAPVLAVACLLLVGWLLLMPHVGTTAEPPGKPKPHEQFAADRRAGAPVQPVPFDGKRAMGYIKDLCALGQRVSGTEAMTKQQELLKT